MTFPTFAAGEVLRAQDMNAVGLWLVKSQAVGAGVASISVTGAFSADYDNYRIIYSGGTASATTDLSLTLGGSATAYFGAMQFQSTTSGTVSAAGTNNGTGFPWLGGSAGAQAVHASFELFNPFLPMYTKIRHATYQNGDNYGSMNGEHRVATGYTSFAITVGTGTITGGTISVYGFKK
jgi:hypothetical protein